MGRRAAFEFGGVSIAAGARQTVDLPVSVLSDHTPVSMSVHVIHGKLEGPTMFVSAGIHGDEVIGVEIVRRLLRTPNLKSLRGTLIVIPIVNAFGFINHSRYLPDRRDLNRMFPGTSGGSLASRLASLFLNEIVARCDLGIDLHSAAIHRTNLPQIRISPDNPYTAELAEVFGAPVILQSPLREGSLRGAAKDIGKDVLLYEAGEGLRFDEMSVRAGVAGILRVMRHIGMLPAKGIAKPKAASQYCLSSKWLRAPAGGLLRTFKADGDVVAKGDVMAIVADPFGEEEEEIIAPFNGIVVGRAVLPIVNEGDAVFHLARVKSMIRAEGAVEELNDQLTDDPLFDEDEII
ncbi:succinylglutamate desuccinylase/aspartoacylase family protein [Sulfitobacter sp. CW3]|jgi:predicted deacylase|uniref:succinylglutamate desuccinylase/aspartoacylase family protein n=1 Tax=unclassified Sulfitobacter TaxID=196795 RepID=UPI001C5E1935|nr:succinylglutamate desuccinylase/aspartoacylase family protein [Sulfitobacter sp. CW3]MBW4961367.1 succinylglutamate desuccinylase/aspartoacylase family protein [Sulfitobacter sp. CW3]